MEVKDVVVVTGGARGIGYGIARSMAAAGYDIALIDLDADRVRAAVDELAAEAPDVHVAAFTADVADRRSVEAAVAAVQGAFGKIDVLVNNAGIIRDKRLVNLDEEDWDAVIATNLKSQFLLCKAIVPGMIERGFGRIINLSSRAWLGGFGQVNYSAAKGGVVSLTRSLAIELAKNGITVNAIAPGIIDTPLFQGFSEEVQQKLKRSVPVQRIGTAEDIAQAALFFAGRASSYITGQLLYVCGGRSLSGPSV